MAEAFAGGLAAKMAIEVGFRFLHIEGDCLSFIQALYQDECFFFRGDFSG